MSAIAMGMNWGTLSESWRIFSLAVHMKRALCICTVHQYHAGQFNSQRLYELRRVRLGWVYLCNYDRTVIPCSGPAFTVVRLLDR